MVGVSVTVVDARSRTGGTAGRDMDPPTCAASLLADGWWIGNTRRVGVVSVANFNTLKRQRGSQLVKLIGIENCAVGALPSSSA